MTISDSKPQVSTAGDVVVSASLDTESPLYAGRRAAHWSYRAVAWIVQAGAAAGAGAAVFAVGRATNADPHSTQDAIALTIFATYALLTVVTMAFTKGQTVGMLVARTQLIHADGRPVGFGFGFLREYVCALMFFIPVLWVVDMLFPIGRERRSLRDHMVNTGVVQMPGNTQRVVPIYLAVALALAGFGVLYVATDVVSREVERADFVASCSEGGAPKTNCRCIYERMRPNVSDDAWQTTTFDFKRDPRLRILLPDEVQSALDNAVKTCSQ